MVTLERPHPELRTEDDVVLTRIAAFVIDVVAFAVVWAVLTVVFGAVSETLGSIMGGAGSALFFLYFIYFEAEYGQTVGKMVMDVVVVTDGGGPIGYRESVIRTVLRLVDWFPYPLHVIGLIAIALTDRRQRLGDVLAETVVVKARDKDDKL
jgi:uncharacterized RDD family membrane protein YckC